jgi:SulP family sulfate permease
MALASIGGWASSYTKCIPIPRKTVTTKNGEESVLDVVKDFNNWKAGVTVALVSVPLSIALGIASGTTPMRGVTTAIWGGLCSGLLGSSDYNIVGPAGALSGMFSSYSIEWGEDVLPWISLVSSAMVAVTTLFKLHSYMLFMPRSVFEGFTVAVAIIIGLKQINFACGLNPAEKSKAFYKNVYYSIMTLNETVWSSLIIFAITTPLLWFLMRKVPKIPWTVVIPVLSIPLGALAHVGVFPFEILTLKSKYDFEPKLVEPLKPLGSLVPPDQMVQFLVASLSTCIVAVLETLISAKIAESRVDRSFDHELEMRGLTLGHITCGLTGAMPPTGVFVRTALNTSLGATYRFSQLLNALVVLIIFMAAMPVFSFLPQATIASMLVVASIRMTPVTYLKQLFREDKGELALCVVTALICVFEDPVVGLAVGAVIALLRGAMATLIAEQTRIDYTVADDGDITCSAKVIGSLTYINADAFVDRARSLDKGTVNVNLDLANLCVIDHDGALAVNKVVTNWLKKINEQRFHVQGVRQDVASALSFFDWFQTGESDCRVSTLRDVTVNTHKTCGDRELNNHGGNPVQVNELSGKTDTVKIMEANEDGPVKYHQV